MHQSIIRACLLGAVAVTGVAHAELQSKEFLINLRAAVPVVSAFEVNPVGWNLSDRQEIEWDAEGKQFKPLTLQVKLKSSVGDVHVKFATADTQKLSHKNDADAYYELSAKVGDKDVGTEKVTVLTQEEAKDGKEVALLVKPGNASAKISDAPLEGKYEGTLPLVFEANVD